MVLTQQQPDEQQAYLKLDITKKYSPVKAISKVEIGEDFACEDRSPISSAKRDPSGEAVSKEEREESDNMNECRKNNIPITSSGAIQLKLERWKKEKELSKQRMEFFNREEELFDKEVEYASTYSDDEGISFDDEYEFQLSPVGVSIPEDYKVEDSNQIDEKFHPGVDLAQNYDQFFRTTSTDNNCSVNKEKREGHNVNEHNVVRHPYREKAENEDKDVFSYIIENEKEKEIIVKNTYLKKEAWHSDPVGSRDTLQEENDPYSNSNCANVSTSYESPGDNSKSVRTKNEDTVTNESDKRDEPKASQTVIPTPNGSSTNSLDQTPAQTKAKARYSSPRSRARKNQLTAWQEQRGESKSVGTKNEDTVTNESDKRDEPKVFQNCKSPALTIETREEYVGHSDIPASNSSGTNSLDQTPAQTKAKARYSSPRSRVRKNQLTAWQEQRLILQNKVSQQKAERVNTKSSDKRIMLRLGEQRGEDSSPRKSNQRTKGAIKTKSQLLVHTGSKVLRDRTLLSKKVDSKHSINPKKRFDHAESKLHYPSASSNPRTSSTAQQRTVRSKDPSSIVEPSSASPRVKEIIKSDSRLLEPTASISLRDRSLLAIKVDRKHSISRKKRFDHVRSKLYSPTASFIARTSSIAQQKARPSSPDPSCIFERNDSQAKSSKNLLKHSCSRKAEQNTTLISNPSQGGSQSKVISHQIMKKDSSPMPGEPINKSTPCIPSQTSVSTSSTGSISSIYQLECSASQRAANERSLVSAAVSSDDSVEDILLNTYNSDNDIRSTSSGKSISEVQKNEKEVNGQDCESASKQTQQRDDHSTSFSNANSRRLSNPEMQVQNCINELFDTAKNCTFHNLWSNGNTRYNCLSYNGNTKEEEIDIISPTNVIHLKQEERDTMIKPAKSNSKSFLKDWPKNAAEKNEKAKELIGEAYRNLDVESMAKICHKFREEFTVARFYIGVLMMEKEDLEKKLMALSDSQAEAFEDLETENMQLKSQILELNTMLDANDSLTRESMLAIERDMSATLEYAMNKAKGLQKELEMSQMKNKRLEMKLKKISLRS